MQHYNEGPYPIGLCLAISCCLCHTISAHNGYCGTLPTMMCSISTLHPIISPWPQSRTACKHTIEPFLPLYRQRK